MADESILSIPIDSSDLPPAQALLDKINSTLEQIEKNTAFGKMTSGLATANKELAKTEKFFDRIFNKIKLSKLADTAFGAVKGGLGIASLSVGGIAAGLIGMAVYGSQGAVTEIEQRKRLGLKDLASYKALAFTSEYGLGVKGGLEGTLFNLVQTMQDVNKQGAFGTLNLNQQKLAAMDPAKALFSVLDALKNSFLNIPTGKNYDANRAQLKAMAESIGIGPEVFLTAIKEGSTRMQGMYLADIGKLTGLSESRLSNANIALGYFNQAMGKLTWELAGAFSPAITAAADVLSNLVETEGPKLAAWVKDVFTPENVKQWEANAKKFLKDDLPKLELAFGELASAIENTASWIDKTLGNHWSMQGMEVGSLVGGALGLRFGLGGGLAGMIAGGYLGGKEGDTIGAVKDNFVEGIKDDASVPGMLWGQLWDSWHKADNISGKTNVSKGHSMHINTLNINVANIPKSPREISDLADYFRSSAMAGVTA